MRLALIGDLHYYAMDAEVPGLLEAREAFYGALLGRFLSEEADYYISLGDLTNTGATSELLGVYKHLGNRPERFIHVIGNHDLYSQQRDSVLALTGQKRNQAIHTDSVSLVTLDTAREMDFENWGGWLDTEQLDWLSEQIQLSADRPLIVCGHHPLYGPTEGSTRTNGSVDPQVPLWEVLQQKQGVGVYINGHTHLDSIAQRDNWTFVQLSAALDQLDYRMLQVDEAGITVSCVEVHDAQLETLGRFIREHMRYFRPTPEGRGNEDQRNCRIAFDSVNHTATVQ